MATELEEKLLEHLKSKNATSADKAIATEKIAADLKLNKGQVGNTLAALAAQGKAKKAIGEKAKKGAWFASE